MPEEQASSQMQNKSSSRGELVELTNMSNNLSSKKRLISIDSDAVGVKFVNVSSRTSFKGSGDHTKLIGHTIQDDQSENIIRVHSRRPTFSNKNSASSQGCGSFDLTKFMPSFLPSQHNQSSQPIDELILSYRENASHFALY